MNNSPFVSNAMKLFRQKSDTSSNSNSPSFIVRHWKAFAFFGAIASIVLLNS